MIVKDPTTQHPTAVVRARMEPVHTPAHYPIGTVIEPATTRRELAPLPVQFSAYDTVGRDHGPRMNRPVQNLAIGEWLGVMSWPFSLIKVPSAMRVPIAPHQGMNPFAERVNVDMPRQTSLGAQSSIKAAPQWAPQYAKLGVWS